MPTIAISGQVKQYPYRTATVRDRYLEVPRELVRALEEHLAEQAGAQMDNHVVYEIIQRDNEPVYILFTDFSAHFGRSVHQRRW